MVCLSTEEEGPGEFMAALVSDLQICKDCQRAMFGRNPEFDSGCAEFTVSVRSKHEIVGLCV